MSAALLCLIVAITDGDTLKARCDGQPAMVTVRLAEIDAPEKRQAFGQRSRQALADMCFQKQAEIRPSATDRYGRTVGRVICVGTDANAAMARGGWAWAYTRYLTDPAIKSAELAARGERAGLWADAHPVEPWLWRHPAKATEDATAPQQSGIARLYEKRIDAAVDAEVKAGAAAIAASRPTP